MLMIHYMDVIKDCYLIWTITEINGGFLSLTYYDQFPTVIALCLISTVIFPLILSSLHLVINSPGIIFGITNEELDGKTNKLMKIITFITSFLCPLFMKNSKENVQEKIEMASEIKTIFGLKMKLQTIQHHLVNFMRIEFGENDI